MVYHANGFGNSRFDLINTNDSCFAPENFSIKTEVGKFLWVFIFTTGASWSFSNKYNLLTIKVLNDFTFSAKPYPHYSAGINVPSTSKQKLTIVIWFYNLLRLIS